MRPAFIRGALRGRAFRGRRLLWLLAVGLGGSAWGGAPAAAQTGAILTRLPDDVGTRHSLEECLLAVGRVLQEAMTDARGERVRRSDLNQTVKYGWPEPDTVRATAARCSARYPLADTLLKEYERVELLRLFARAHRDAEITAAMTRWLAALPAADTAARRVLEDTLLTAYSDARRASEVRRVLEERVRRAAALPLNPVGLLERSRARVPLINFADTLLKDTALAQAQTRQLMAEVEQVPASDRPPEVTSWAFSAFMRRHRQELLDSLRQSTASFDAALRDLWRRTGGPERDRPVGSATRPILPPVTGDFWFRRGDSAASRPTRGKVGLVVLLSRLNQDWEPSPHYNWDWICLPGRSPTTEEAGTDDPANWVSSTRAGCPGLDLRGLARRFPELEITLAVRTQGFFATVAVEPAREAELIRQWLHDAQQLPGALAVTTGPLRRAPAPDRRVGYRIDKNTLAYPNGPHATAFLVDREGRYVAGAGEADFEEMIEAVLRQGEGPKKGAAVPAPVPATQ